MDNLKIVTTCVNYTDYLYHTLPHNVYISEDLTVITSPNDFSTKKFCQTTNIKYIEMINLGAQGKAFDWGGAYNIFLKQNNDSWILIIDADIFLPKLLKSKIDIQNLDKSTIYYTSRAYLPMDYEIIFDNIDIAKNVERYDNVGWHILPAHCWGYFMLFFNDNRQWSHNDVIFGQSFDKMECLPLELSVAHIPHGTWADWAKNFYGRQTPMLKSLYQNKIKG